MTWQEDAKVVRQAVSSAMVGEWGQNEALNALARLIAAHDYISSWVPFDYLPDRPQEFAQVWYEREGRLRELLEGGKP